MSVAVKRCSTRGCGVPCSHVLFRVSSRAREVCVCARTGEQTLHTAYVKGAGAAHGEKEAAYWSRVTAACSSRSPALTATATPPTLPRRRRRHPGRTAAPCSHHGKSAGEGEPLVSPWCTPRFFTFQGRDPPRAASPDPGPSPLCCARHHPRWRMHLLCLLLSAYSDNFAMLGAARTPNMRHDARQTSMGSVRQV